MRRGTTRCLLVGLLYLALRSRLSKQGLSVWEKVLGPDHLPIAWALENLARLLRETNRRTEATLLEIRAGAIRAKHAQENPTK